jgi:hypothetical protein
MRRVWTDVVVVESPALDHGSGPRQVDADLMVQALIAQLAVEAPHKAVLLQLSRRDVIPVDAGAINPFQHGSARHLSPVVADDCDRLATPGDQAVRVTGHALTADRGVHEYHQGPAREVVHDAQDSEAPAAPHRQALSRKGRKSFFFMLTPSRLSRMPNRR